jgi:hypothetical protein
MSGKKHSQKSELCVTENIVVYNAAWLHLIKCSLIVHVKGRIGMPIARRVLNKMVCVCIDVCMYVYMYVCMYVVIVVWRVAV